MQLHDLLVGVGVDVLELVGDPRVEIATVSHDSRRTGPRALFCCIRGLRVDGHDHAIAAVAAGATALLVERVLPLPVPQARVASVRRSIGPLAARAAGDPARAMRVIGVTGTNGKTTTAHFVAAIGRAAEEDARVIGTLSGERTTPEAPELQAALVEMRDSGVTTIAMEVSSHALAQHRVDGTWFAAVGFTNLSHEHLDYHGSLDAYFEAKARLFAPEFTSAAAVNTDDPRGPVLAQRATARGLVVRTYSVEGPADVRIEAVEPVAHGFRAFLAAAEGRAPIRVSLLGHFNVENAAAAAALTLSAGLPFDAVVAGLARAQPVPGRVERIAAGQPFTVLVDYAHTPDALDHALRAGRALVGPQGRVLVVFGCGGDRDRAKRPAMGRVAAEHADLVVVTSDNPRWEDPATIAAEVAAGAERDVTVELDRRIAIGLALSDARAGDVVLIAGKGHETGQTIGAETLPFDDRVVAREELEAVAWT